MGHYPAPPVRLQSKRKGVNNTKRVPQNLHELLTPRALAYWFMDDGASYQNGRNRAYRLNRAAKPPFGRSSRLVQALNNNFDIDATIQNTQHYYSYYIFVQNLQSVLST